MTIRIRLPAVLVALVAAGAAGGAPPLPQAVGAWQRNAADRMSCHARAVRALSDADERGLDAVERDCAERTDPFQDLR